MKMDFKPAQAAGGRELAEVKRDADGMSGI